jgi:hypothetical protein
VVVLFEVFELFGRHHSGACLLLLDGMRPEAFDFANHCSLSFPLLALGLCLTCHNTNWRAQVETDASADRGSAVHSFRQQIPMASCIDDFSEDKSVADDVSVANLEAFGKKGSEATTRTLLSSFSYDKMDNNHTDSHLSVSTGPEAYTTICRIPPPLPINFAFNM